MPNPSLQQRAPKSQDDNRLNRESAPAFNPYGLYSIHIPLGLLTFPGVSWGAKCLYGRLALFRGRKVDGFCAPGIDQMAAAMGVSIDRIHSWLSELVKAGFISRRRHGPGRAAECVFLSHPALTDLAKSPDQSGGVDIAKSPDQEAPLILGFCGSDTAKSPDLDIAKSPDPYKEENIHSENIHENRVSSSVEAALTLRPHDDEPRSSENGKTEGYEALLSVARDQLRMARAQSLGVTLEHVVSPDREITIQILQEFEGYPDFNFWIKGTIRRRLARKATSATWGIYLADARNQATAAKLKREEGERIHRLLNTFEKAETAMNAEARRVMESLTHPAEAISRAACSIPWALKAHLMRAGEAVSPNEVNRRAREWKRCSDCDETGKLGDAIDRNLRFCGCRAGIEASYRDGADWPAREIARVHESARSLLVAACSLDSDFVADAVQEADVQDDGQTVTITPAGLGAKLNTIQYPDVHRALERVGWVRDVRICGRVTPPPNDAVNSSPPIKNGSPEILEVLK